MLTSSVMTTSSRALLIALIVVVAAVAPALAVDYTVGDGAGWTLRSVNYIDWANGKDFQVGDYLTFSYPPGVHNVLEVNRGDSEGCTSSDPAATPYISGRDAILLDSPGEKWYICDIGDHCEEGMKLGINVSAATEGLPPPTAVMGSSDAGEMSPLRSCRGMLLVMAAYRIIMG